MRDILIKLFMKINAFLIRVSSRRIGSKLGTQTILLLETTGRKSGRPHEIPIAYFHHEGKYLIVASNWGRDYHADWYLNLLENPHAKLTVNGKMIRVEGHDVQGDEYARLWKFVTEKHPPFLNYQKMTSRRIPIMLFEMIEQ